jgi:hypothetical protein
VITARRPVDLARWQKGESSLTGGTRIGHYERVLPMLGEPLGTDDAVRSVRSGDGQVEYRVVGSGPSVAGVPGTIAGAATIVTVHEFSSRRSNSLVPFGRVGDRDAIEETRGRRRWMKRSPLASHAF